MPADQGLSTYLPTVEFLVVLLLAAALCLLCALPVQLLHVLTLGAGLFQLGLVLLHASQSGAHALDLRARLLLGGLAQQCRLRLQALPGQPPRQRMPLQAAVRAAAARLYSAGSACYSEQ